MAKKERFSIRLMKSHIKAQKQFQRLKESHAYLLACIEVRDANLRRAVGATVAFWGRRNYQESL